LTFLIALVCFFAAAIAVGVAALLSAITPAIPAWLIGIVQGAVLLIAYVWLRVVLGV
jgi:hypothetical protein